MPLAAARPLTVADSAADLIGNTPMVRLHLAGPDAAERYMSQGILG